MNVRELLREAAEVAGVERRDAEVLLCHVLGRARSYLYGWPEAPVPPEQEVRFRALVAQRADGAPVAYLTGEREFWSLSLKVTPATLIPRPETELLVVRALALSLPVDARALDLGTGSGAIALALASERPQWRVVAVDASEAALDAARENAARLGLERVRFLAGSWFAPVAGERFHVIVSNPPYVAEDDPHLGEGDLRFEPRSALVAAENGLADIAAIIAGAPEHLTDNGWLLFEHGYGQGAAVRSLLESSGFASVETWRDDGGRDRVTGGCRAR